MPKFTFIGEHTDLYGKPDGTKVTYEFEVDTLDNILEHVELFIKGCGYMPPPGVLDYINDEPQEWCTEEFQTPTDTKYNPDEISHSGFYYDTERNK